MFVIGNNKSVSINILLLKEASILAVHELLRRGELYDLKVNSGTVNITIGTMNEPCVFKFKNQKCNHMLIVYLKCLNLDDKLYRVRKEPSCKFVINQKIV